MKENNLFVLNLDGDDGKILNEISIGSINFSGKAGNCKIFIRTEEGENVPHFHIESMNIKNNKPAFKSAIKIFEANYFLHGQYKSTLNNKQKEVLNNFLNEPFKNSNYNKWQIIRNEWFRANNEDMSYGESRIPQPNYNMLP